MSLPAFQQPETASRTGNQPGLDRAARLMRMLGPAAAGVWNELSAGETANLRQAMTAGPIQPRAGDAAELRRALSRQPDLPASEPQNIWQRLCDLEAGALAGMLQEEHPQTLSLILSQMPAPGAAKLVHALPRPAAIKAMRGLMLLGPVHPATLRTIEAQLEALAATRTDGFKAAGPVGVARIFDRLSNGLETSFLKALEASDPGCAARIRAHMFTFDDLAALGPAAIQTVLSQVDRSVLALALKGAGTPVREVFMKNMTKRAGELLVSEIGAAGPVKRSRVEAARTEITDIARHLARRGDILARDDIDDELIE